MNGYSLHLIFKTIEKRIFINLQKYNPSANYHKKITPMSGKIFLFCLLYLVFRTNKLTKFLENFVKNSLFRYG